MCSLASVVSDSYDPMDCSLSGSSVHGIFQARILDWIAISFSRAASWPRDWTQVSWTAGRFFTNLAKHYFWGLLIKFNIWYSSSFTAATRNSSNHIVLQFLSGLHQASEHPLQWESRKDYTDLFWEHVYRYYNMSHSLPWLLKNSSEAKHIISRKAFLKFKVRICKE